MGQYKQNKRRFGSVASPAQASTASPELLEAPGPRSFRSIFREVKDPPRSAGQRLLLCRLRVAVTSVRDGVDRLDACGPSNS